MLKTTNFMPVEYNYGIYLDNEFQSALFEIRLLNGGMLKWNLLKSDRELVGKQFRSKNILFLIFGLLIIFIRLIKHIYNSNWTSN